MGACTSKTKKNKEKHLKNDVTNAGSNNKKNSIAEQVQQQSSSTNADKFANVPFIDSEEKLTTTTPPPPPPPPPLSAEESIPTHHDNDNDERTTVKTNFETNVSYSSAETIDKLKQEAYTFLREKIFPIKEEKQKLIDYVHKRIIGNTTDSAIIDESLEQCFSDIENHQHPDSDINNKIKRRLMNIVTVYVSSQSSDNSFLKALYDKMGPSLDLNSLNAETNEHEVVNVTVTKTVRQVFVDGSSTLIPNSNSTNEPPNSVIHTSNNEHHIPADLPDDIRQQGQSYLPDKQTSFERQQYNNQNSKEEYSVNDRDANIAATKIQAQFRGHKTRRDFQKKKQQKNKSIASNQQDSGSDYIQSSKLNDEYSVNDKDANIAATKIQAQFRGHKTRRDFQKKKQEKKKSIDSNNANLNDGLTINDKDANVAATKIQAQFRGHKTRRDLQKKKQENKISIDDYQTFDKQQFEEEFTEKQKREQERAAIAIQAQYRGYQTRKTLRQSSVDKNESKQQEFDKMPISINFNDRHDLDENLTAQDATEADENDDTDQSDLEPESIELSDNFEKHTQIPRDSNFVREQQAEIFNNEIDMNDPTLDKAATRIQASYRGYKTRKELGTGSVGNNSNPGLDQQLSPSISSEIHNEYDNTRNKNILSPSVEGNEVPAGEDDDNAAAVKIQAAYRGYRVRKDLEK